MTAAAEYLGNIWKGVWTAMVGMSITFKYLLKKPVTVQYPNEQMPVNDRYRGIHYLEQDKCIYCFQCARACPIDCIEMDAVRDKKTKTLDWKQFTLDYQKCMFCELCVYPCPEDCIHEGKEFAFVAYDRSEFVLDLLTWKGFDPSAPPPPPAEEKKPAPAKAAAAKPAAAAKTAAEPAAKEPATKEPAKVEEPAAPDAAEPAVEKAAPEKPAAEESATSSDPDPASDAASKKE